MKTELLYKAVGKFISRYDVEIATGASVLLGSAAMLGTVGATRSYDAAVEQKKAETGRDNLSFKEKAGLILRHWSFPILTKASSDACAVYACVKHEQGMGKLSTALAMSEEALRRYMKSAKEVAGNAREEEVRQKLAQEDVNRVPLGDPNWVKIGEGPDLCFDAVLGRYFWGSKVKIDAAENYINRMLLSENWVNLNNLYYDLRVPQCRFGDENGAVNIDGSDKPFTIRCTPVWGDDGVTHVTHMDYDWTPYVQYLRR